MPTQYEVSEIEGSGWGVFDPWGELVVIFDNVFEANKYARMLNDPKPE
jgi:hypothetical protein